MNHTLLINDGIAVRSKRTSQRLISIEHPVLIEVNGAQQVRLLDLARLRLNLPTQQPEQSRLATPIRPHQANPHPGGNRKIQPTDQLSPIDGIVRVNELNQQLRLPISRNKIDPRGRRLAPR